MAALRSKPATIAAVLMLIAVVAVVPVYAQTLTVSTDKTTYLPGETVVVSGQAPPGQTVMVTIINPDGKEVDVKTATAGMDGTYRTTFRLPSTLPYSDWKPGTYTVRAYLGTVTAEAKFQLIAGGVVRGRVVDETGAPVPDATVAVVETGASTTTGADGRFSLMTGAGDFTIVVSKQGYTSATVKVTVGTGEIKDLGNIRIVSYMYLLNTTLADLMARVQALNESLSSVASTVEVLGKAVSALSSKVDAVSGSVEDLKKTVGALSTALATVNASIGEVSKALSELSGSIAALASTVNAVSSKVDTVSSKVDAVSSSVAALTGTVNAVSRAVSDLRTAVDSLTGKVDAVSSKVDSVSTAVTGVSNAVNAVSSKVDSAIKAISDLNTAVTGVGGKVDTVSNKVDAVSGAVGALQTYIIVTLVLALIGAVTGIYAVVLLSKKLAA